MGGCASKTNTDIEGGISSIPFLDSFREMVNTLQKERTPQETQEIVLTFVDNELRERFLDECVKDVESFDKQYRFDVEDVVQGDCIQDAIYPNCNEGALCDHEYAAFSKGEDDKYNSSDASGFSMVFWQATMDDDRVDYWTMYALVGRTSKNPKEYVAYRLQQVGAATEEMVTVSDWFELLPVSYDDGENAYFRQVPISTANVQMATITFDVPTDGFVDDVQVGDVLNVSNGNAMVEKMHAKVTSIVGGVAHADITLPAEFDPSEYYVEIYRHSMVGYGIEISDPSWVFSGNADYKLTMKYPESEDYEDYELTIPTYVVGEYEIKENTTYYAYSNRGNIRPIGFQLTALKEEDGYITYDAKMEHPVPTYEVVTRHVDDGELVVEKEQKPYPIRVTFGNVLTWRTIDESWSIKSNTTRIKIPKSYDFRFYNTPISVQEFVDLYNATKPQCIYPVDGVLILADDDDDPETTDYWIKDLSDMDKLPSVILLDSVIGTSAVYPDVVDKEPDPEGSHTKYVAIAADGYLNPSYEN